MKKKVVLITGGCGFIGSNLAEDLLKKGHKVIILDDLSRSATSNIRAFYNYSPDFYFIKGSITDFTLVNSYVFSCWLIYFSQRRTHHKTYKHGIYMDIP